MTVTWSREVAGEMEVMRLGMRVRGEVNKI